MTFQTSQISLDNEGCKISLEEKIDLVTDYLPRKYYKNTLLKSYRLPSSQIL